MCPDYNLRLERDGKRMETRQEKRIRNIKKIMRMQGHNCQDVSLEDDLQETETSIQHSGSNNRSENENITGNSGNSSGKMKETMKKRDADDSIKTDVTKNETDIADNQVNGDMEIKMNRQKKSRPKIP